MIYVELNKLKDLMPPELKKDLEDATSKLIALPESERTRFIRTHARLWSKVKPYLAQLTGNFPEDYKCWYCEAKDVRSKYEVDHFRPKSQVHNKGCPAEPGYWWLAFDPTNYRLSCSLCNTPKRGDEQTFGKWDQFPLKEGSFRARTSEDNINDEISLLLDPTKPPDPGFISFGDDGRAYPRHAENTFFYEKASVSIDALNLNDVRIQEARKQLRQKCLDKIEEGDREYRYYSRTGSSSAETAFIKVCKQIMEMTSPYSEFSAMALCYFCGSGLDWVLSILRQTQTI